MIRLIWRFGLLVALAALFAWLADRPGVVTIRWLGREIETPLMAAVIALGLALILLWFLWSFLRRLWRAPGTMGEYVRFRRARRGYQSLSKGIIAAGAGDALSARRHAQVAAKGLSDEPLVRLLEAQAAQLHGDRPGVKRAFEAMLGAPDTEALGLRGLFADARQAGDLAAARGYAERALKLNSGLTWASAAMLSLHTAAREWDSAAGLLDAQRRSGVLKPAEADAKKAIALAAQALTLERSDRPRALDLALKAHKLDPALVPAALVAGRIHAQDGALRRAMKVLRETWGRSAHPDLGDAAAFAKLGDTPAGRLARVRDLIAAGGGGGEGRIALARAALGAREWAEARKALEPLLDGRPQARVCALMADVEEGETGDKGRAREWLARAMRGAHDPMWVVDGVALPQWSPVSPVTGELAVAEWKVPYDQLEPPEPEPAPAEEPPPQAIAAAPPKPEPAKPALPRQPDDPGPKLSVPVPRIDG